MRGQVKVYQKKIVARRRRRAFFITLYSVALAGLIVCGLSLLSQLESLAIRSVEVSGNARLSKSQIESIAAAHLAGNYDHLFSKRNAFLYPKEAIREELEQIPLLREVKVSRRGLAVLVVSVAERAEESLWCSGEPGDTSDCYSMDANGFLFAKRERLCGLGQVCMPSPGTQGAPFIYRGLLSADPLGKQFLSSEDIKKTRFFIDQVNGLSIDAREAVLSNTGYLTLVLEKGGRLVINMSDDLSELLGNIGAIITNKAIAPSFDGFLANLDYIKLDTGNKVVYKMKGSTTTRE